MIFYFIQLKYEFLKIQLQFDDNRSYSPKIFFNIHLQQD